MDEHLQTGAGETVLTERLGLILEWYRGMVSERTGRLVYLYDPERETVVEDGEPIRELASVWDAERVGNFLGRTDLVSLTERSLRHYLAWLVPRDGALALDGSRLGEPTSIAHSAFLALGLCDSALSQRGPIVRGLAEGILRQQRADGSYRIHFGREPDTGLEFYPGEAMLALMKARPFADAQRCLDSVERGFQFCRRARPAHAVSEDLLVFYANWQSQYGSLLHASSESEAVQSAVRDHVFALHDRVIETGFYERLARDPLGQATVEVACALEGLNDAYAIASREGDGVRSRYYAGCIQTAASWLLRAQRIDRCTPRERGGFGQSLEDRTQRIDVTGHALGGLIATAHNRLGA